MKLQTSNHQSQSSGKSIITRSVTEKIKKIIHLNDMVSPGNPLRMQKKTDDGRYLDESGSETNRPTTAKSLFDSIVHYVNQNNFAKADQLREKLIAEAPTAVREIVSSGEIIEQKKTASMNPETIRPWADLFNQFNTSEAVAFYFALKDFVVKPNQPVFQQGNVDNRLYFIASGSLKLKYFDYDVRKNVLITTLRQGDIAGVETFFTLSNHTTNLIAAEESKIYYLEKSAYHQILAENHAIESKLLRFCEKKQITFQQKEPEGQTRRAHKRYKTELFGHVQRFDQNGKLGEEISEATIIDISAGGLGYRVRNLKIGEAAHLHNSRISISAPYQKYSVMYELKKTAKVVSLKFHPFGECSVHVQFEEPMNEDRVMEIAQFTDVTAYI